MKVDFFLIGPPRCASTSLAAFLAEHSQVCFSDPKEPLYFCPDVAIGVTGELGTIDDYHESCFRGYKPGQHRLVGEGTPFYLMSGDAVPSILQYNPKAHFVSFVRNPIEIAISMHAARVRAGPRHENIPDFEEAWNAQEDRRLGLRLPHEAIKAGILQYRWIASIGTQYKRLFELVPRAQVHIVVFEDLKKDFGKEAGGILDFLGLERTGDLNAVHKEAATQWSSEAARQLYYRLARMMPFSLNLGILRKLRRKLERVEPPPGLRTEFRRQLRSEFDGEIQLLSELLGRDFSEWR